MRSPFGIRSASSFSNDEAKQELLSKSSSASSPLVKPVTRSRRVSSVRMGPASILTLVIVICLAVLGVLTAATASANSNMANRQAQFVADDYANETAGQIFYAQADDIVAGIHAQGGSVDDAAAALNTALPLLIETVSSQIESNDTVDDDTTASQTENSSNASDDAASSDGATASQAESGTTATTISTPTISAEMQGNTLLLHVKAASGRCLDARFAITADVTLSVERWGATTAWVADDTDILWTGQ